MTVSVALDGRRLDVAARLGDANREPGVEIGGWLYAAKGIPTGELVFLRAAFDGTAGQAKLWAESEPEPDWDLALPYEEWPLEETDDEDLLAITVRVGNDGGPAQVLSLRPLVFGGGALPGEAVGWHVVGRGDGVTDTFLTRYAYVPGSLQVRVDGQSITGPGIAAMDGPGRSFRLARALYVDPTDATGSALVEARYTRA